MTTKQIKNIIILMHNDYKQALETLNETGNLNVLYKHGLCNYVYMKKPLLKFEFWRFLKSHELREKTVDYIKYCFHIKYPLKSVSGYWWSIPVDANSNRDKAICLQKRIDFLQWIIDNEL